MCVYFIFLFFICVSLVGSNDETEGIGNGPVNSSSHVIGLCTVWACQLLSCKGILVYGAESL